MEDIHGVDVSWLHHSNRDKHFRGAVQHASPPSGLAKDAPPPTSKANHTLHENGGAVKAPAAPATPPQNIPAAATNGHATSTPQKNASPKRPSLIGRASGDKATSSLSTDTAKGSSPRRMSWMSKISSNLSSQQSPSAKVVKVNAAPTNGHAQIANSKPAIAVEHAPVQEEAEPTPPPMPSKSGKEGFFSNALRRLSSNTGMGSGKSVPNGGICPRKTLNVDPNRPRCLLPELDSAKLRKVAFCVDVEIAGGPRYKDEADCADKKKKKKKDAKLKEKGEGEALKHPDAVADHKDATGTVETPCGTEDVGSGEEPSTEANGEEKKETTRKQEKKKKSEQERKERKEQRRRKAEETGSIPVQIRRDSDENGVPFAAPPRPMDRPTTDPLRIYRRCCQLRETPVLKRITEQLAQPTVCLVDAPGTVSCLDLTGSRLQLADMVTLSDWLAVVPVRRLNLEDADLTDEGVRNIMAGLLAAKSTDYFARQRRMTDMANAGTHDEKLGVVQKLSLKNNPRIGKEGWKHISLFVYMCHSLKALDVSMINFPVSPEVIENEDGTCRPNPMDPAEIFSKSISERLGGDTFEELIMAECNLSTKAIRKIVDGVTMSGLKRLGLAGNRLNKEGLSHVIRYMRSGVCQGLDLGSNDLRELIADLAAAMNSECNIWALSLADCNLQPATLKPLMPALLKLHNFRFLDLSHNHDLFSEQPSALGLLRKYMPAMKNLKRVHLMDVGLTPAQAIALAEVLPETPSLAHVNLMQNPQLSALASATEVATQEEACALYASLMIAARVSRNLICVDIDVPTSDSSDMVKAMAKQVVAYCLRNMEHFAATELPPDTELPTPGQSAEAGVDAGEAAGIQIPDVLLDLIGEKGHQHTAKEAPNEDYMVGGAGVVKALSYCLSEKASEVRHGSMSMPTSGTATPREIGSPTQVSAHKAKEMSRDLLDSARKIRRRLQPAMIKEARKGDDMAYRRLLFLDNTLQGMIARFEEEYPDCRVAHEDPSSPTAAPGASTGADLNDAASSISSTSATDPSTLGASDVLTQGSSTGIPAAGDSDEEFADAKSRFSLTSSSRRGSDMSLASRAQAKEEGHIHRLSQRVKKEILPAAGFSHEEPSMSALDPEREPEHLRVLRAKLEAMDADEWLRFVREHGWEEAAKRLTDKAVFLRELESRDPGELGRIGDALVREGRMEEREWMEKRGVGGYGFEEATTVPTLSGGVAKPVERDTRVPDS